MEKIEVGQMMVGDSVLVKSELGEKILLKVESEIDNEGDFYAIDENGNSESWNVDNIISVYSK